jgi:hypothetical protein
VSSVQQVARDCLFLGFVATISTTSSGQEDVTPPSRGYGGPFAGVPVLNAPFSADATVLYTRMRDDGTSIEQRAKARYYRDSAGHVRAEWVDIGLGGQNRTAGRYTSIWITPGDGSFYAMDPSDQTFRGLPGFHAADMFHGGQWVIRPLGTDTYQRFFDLRSRDWIAADEVALGHRQSDGMNTIGRRITMAMPGNEEANMVEERWESPELKVVLHSLVSHARSGASVDYRLTNISRREPPPQLFVVPPDTIDSGGNDSDGRRWILRVRPSPR